MPEKDPSPELNAPELRQEIRRFLLNLVRFSLFPGMVALIGFFIVPANYYSPAVPFLFFFFFSVTFLNFSMLLRASRKKFIRFINYYILSTALKLVLFIALLVAYILLNRNDALPFGIWFFFLYLCFTFFEVFALVRNMKSNRE